MEQSIKDAGKQNLQCDTHSTAAVFLFLFFLYSNNSWFGVGSSYSGVYERNTTDNIPPSSDVYYLLNFNNILTSYGKSPVSP